MLHESFEFKVQVQNPSDRLPWEMLPVLFTRSFDVEHYDDAIKLAAKLADTVSGLTHCEVRWNHWGSGQGHYVASLDTKMGR
jgi:hypothetical protein